MSDELPKAKDTAKSLDERFANRPHTYHRLQQIADQMDEAIANGATADQGWPIGSGAVESACRQAQCRLKRPGQFWTERGLKNLCALDSARHNDHWDDLWNLN